MCEKTKTNPKKAKALSKSKIPAAPNPRGDYRRITGTLPGRYWDEIEEAINDIGPDGRYRDPAITSEITGAWLDEYENIPSSFPDPFSLISVSLRFAGTDQNGGPVFAVETINEKPGGTICLRLTKKSSLGWTKSCHNSMN
jgi:hypothetical protein